MGCGWFFFQFLRVCDIGRCCVSSLPTRRAFAWCAVLEDMQERAAARSEAASKTKEGLDGRLATLRESDADVAEVQRFVESVVDAEERIRVLCEHCRLLDIATNDLVEAMQCLDRCMRAGGGALRDVRAETSGQTSSYLASLAVPADNDTVRAFDRAVGSIETVYIAFCDDESDSNEIEADVIRIRGVALDIMEFGFTTRQPESFAVRAIDDDVEIDHDANENVVKENTGYMIGVLTNWIWSE
jgi:hypothetical protein